METFKGAEVAPIDEMLERTHFVRALRAQLAEAQRLLDAANAELHNLRIKAGLRNQWTERIACPMCGTKQDATVFREPGQPWAVRVHGCQTCAYEIMESEWFVLEDQSATEKESS